MFKRRDVLRLAVGSAVTGGMWPAARSGAQTRDWFAESFPFSSAQVVEKAAELSKRPFVAPPNDMPAGFANLPYEQ